MLTKEMFKRFVEELRLQSQYDQVVITDDPHDLSVSIYRGDNYIGYSFLKKTLYSAKASGVRVSTVTIEVNSDNLQDAALRLLKMSM